MKFQISYSIVIEYTLYGWLWDSQLGWMDSEAPEVCQMSPLKYDDSYFVYKEK